MASAMIKALASSMAWSWPGAHGGKDLDSHGAQGVVDQRGDQAVRGAFGTGGRCERGVQLADAAHYGSCRPSFLTSAPIRQRDHMIIR